MTTPTAAALIRLDRLTATYDDPTAREAFEQLRGDVSDGRVAMRRRAEVAEAQLGFVLDILGRRKRAAHTSLLATVQSDGEVAELGEATGRWNAQRETLAQVLRALDRD